MRITVLDDDSGRSINPGREHYRVLLDGEEIKHFFTADDEKGEVIETVIDEGGHMIAENSEAKRRIRHGKVIIRCIS